MGVVSKGGNGRNAMVGYSLSSGRPGKAYRFRALPVWASATLRSMKMFTRTCETVANSFNGVPATESTPPA